MQVRLTATEEPVSQILFDAETINLMDSTATDMLLELQKNMTNKGITLAFACVHDAVKEKMQLAGVVDAVGSNNFYDSILDGVEAFGKEATSTQLP